MKIDVITLQAVKNYGSVLQAFATKKLFESYGHKVSIINFQKTEAREENLMKFWAGNNIIKKIVMFPTIKKWKKIFDEFCFGELEITGDKYTSKEDFETFPLDADLYCTGSDQVWNSKWNNGILPMLYLDFVPADCYKFAFAASFGQDHLTEDEVNQTKGYITQYNRISVREESAKNIIEEQYQYPNCYFIIDPTLCMDRFFWRKYTKNYKYKEDYILIYNLNRSKDLDSYAKKLAKKTGLKLKRLCMRYDQILKCGDSIIIPEIFEFVSLIDHARYVLTDSFHATAFSMNMNTQPICIYPNEFGGRIESFLKMIDCLGCHVQGYNDYDVLERTVDFDKVNTILDQKRNEVQEYLEAVFNEAAIFC